MHLHYLHLSNLLIVAPSHTAQDDKLQALLDLVRAWDEQGIVLDFIVISGDIAESGQPGQYQIAQAFCERLISAAQLPPQRLFVTPGNHDVDREQVKALHVKRLYAFDNQHELTELLGDAQSLHLLTQKFAAFNRFAQRVMARPLLAPGCYGWAAPLALDKQGWCFTLNLLGLNSSVFAGYDGDKQQKLAVSQHQLAMLQQELDGDALFNLALLHHPPNTWHGCDTATWTQLQDNMQVILTGPTSDTEPLQAPVFAANAALCRLTDVDLTGGACTTQAYRYQQQTQDWRLSEQAVDAWCIPGLQSRYQAYQQHRPALYIARLELTAFQCFADLSLQLTDDFDDLRLWVMCLGDNSSGKSAILRSLGIGLARDPSALQPHIHTPLLRRGTHKGSIRIDLMTPEAVTYRMCTDISLRGGREHFERRYYRVLADASEQTLREHDFPWSQLFVCGYGTGRSLEEDAGKQVSFDAYDSAQAVAPLLNNHRPMQHPELSLRRIIGVDNPQTAPDAPTQADILQRFQALISDVLMLAEGERVELTSHGLEVVRAQQRTPLTAEGDGYRNTAAWVLDLLTWKMLQTQTLDPKTLTGIVLIDEIEQHLHPRWQRHILPLLQRQFPQLQFITTSHSPLCAGSLVDLPECAQALLMKFSRRTDQPLSIALDAIQGLKADQILTSDAFDLPTTRNSEMAKKLARYAALFLQHPELNEAEQQEYATLQRDIETQLPEPAEQASTRAQQATLRERLNQLQSSPPSGKTE